MYRTELILGRYLTDHLRKSVLQYQIIKVILRYINVMESDGTCENSQVSAARCNIYSAASVIHFLDDETLCPLNDLSFQPS